MKEQEDKVLDLFLKNAIKELRPEEVSENFNERLFQRIAQLNTKELKYKPLISKTVWFSLALVLIGLLGFAFIMEPNTNFWLFSLKYNTIGNLDFFDVRLREIKWNSSSYAVLGFVIFILFQILFLKHYFSKHRVII
ncbi:MULTISPECIES: hypothetical protein [Maribacter]|uniref:DUF3379 domain-containing protein n=1 Tax=Maribacter flavus TaxID=1658664 RepID=A0ABU7ILP4_9FLAO|nr:MULTISPECIES: hypothetical protein [Maribacter]MDC6406675.1 hypothetical protein [Maribacter sp. PR66]MEE1973883.1 hypothetical protein [Maribacter flavus]